jgi:hypothetical protein
VADFDPTFVQKIFDISQLQRKSHVHHNRQADDLWARFEVPEWRVFLHHSRLGNRPARLKKVSSDSAFFNV